MRVAASDVSGWLKHPVTEAFLEAVKEGRDDWAKAVLVGNCKSGDPKSTTSELYHFHLGVLEAYDNCLSPVDVLETHDKIAREDQHEEKT